ncbi:tetratricopeptide repeat protein [Streptomyces anulatus]|uniref:tetratricopeptide repeat protein n=1 Tax=Streptomyces anulatus TaxID=1892 RepID=UPI0036875F60
MAVPGLDRAGMLAARAGSALCAGTLGRTRDALGELKSVLAEQRSLLGPGRPAVLDTRYEIAVPLVRTGERHAAEELLRRLADEEDPRGTGHAPNPYNARTSPVHQPHSCSPPPYNKDDVRPSCLVRQLSTPPR